MVDLLSLEEEWPDPGCRLADLRDGQMITKDSTVAIGAPRRSRLDQPGLPDVDTVGAARDISTVCSW